MRFTPFRSALWIAKFVAALVLLLGVVPLVLWFGGLYAVSVWEDRREAKKVEEHKAEVQAAKRAGYCAGPFDFSDLGAIPVLPVLSKNDIFAQISQRSAPPPSAVEFDFSSGLVPKDPSAVNNNSVPILNPVVGFAPDGTRGVIPMARAREAVKAGFRLATAPIPDQIAKQQATIICK